LRLDHLRSVLTERGDADSEAQAAEQPEEDEPQGLLRTRLPRERGQVDDLDTLNRALLAHPGCGQLLSKHAGELHLRFYCPHQSGVLMFAATQGRQRLLEAGDALLEPLFPGLERDHLDLEL